MEFTGLKGQSGDAIMTTIGRNYVYSAEGINLNDGANLAVDRNGLADGGFRGIHVLFLRVGLLNEREGVRGKTIRQDKMLHGSHPLVDLLGQISRSNAGSKLSVKIVGRIHWSNCWSNSRIKFTVELLDQIDRSNSWIKLLDQICRSNAANPRPDAGEPRRTHGRACEQPENSLGRAGNGQRKGPRGEAWACDGLALERATWRLMIRVAVFLKRNRILNVIGKRSGPHTVASRKACVVIAQSFVRYLLQCFLVFDDVSIQETFDSV